MKEYSVSILAHGTVFHFPLEEEEAAWYDLDQAVSAACGATLTLNADREVYACLREADGSTFWGIIGEEEDEPLPDNFPVAAGDQYYFHDHPETENAYL